MSGKRKKCTSSRKSPKLATSSRKKPKKAKEQLSYSDSEKQFYIDTRSCLDIGSPTYSEDLKKCLDLMHTHYEHERTFYRTFFGNDKDVLLLFPNALLYLIEHGYIILPPHFAALFSHVCPKDENEGRLAFDKTLVLGLVGALLKTLPFIARYWKAVFTCIELIFAEFDYPYLNIYFKEVIEEHILTLGMPQSNINMLHTSMICCCPIWILQEFVRAGFGFEDYHIEYAFFQEEPDKFMFVSQNHPPAHCRIFSDVKFAHAIQYMLHRWHRGQEEIKLERGQLVHVIPSDEYIGKLTAKEANKPSNKSSRKAIHGHYEMPDEMVVAYLAYFVDPEEKSREICVDISHWFWKQCCDLEITPIGNAFAGNVRYALNLQQLEGMSWLISMTQKAGITLAINNEFRSSIAPTPLPFICTHKHISYEQAKAEHYSQYFAQELNFSVAQAKPIFQIMVKALPINITLDLIYIMIAYLFAFS